MSTDTFDHSNGCTCRTGPVLLHGGHCCFDAGAVEDYADDKPLPCGHEMPT